MLCYQDKTFCVNSDTCQNGKTCNRAYNDKVREGAAKCGLLVAVAKFEDCYVPKSA